MHDASCMLTLTYDDDHLPQYGQLHKEHLQKFFKRLRKNFSQNFKYVASGEYGDINRRPHFHIALFGQDFAFDRKKSGSPGGHQSYQSASVAQSWSLGSHHIGSLTFESAAYIARYILKKIKGPGASSLPLFLDPHTGEITMPNPEFLIMSKGIGRSWFREFFMTDVYPHGSVVTAQGTKAPVPRFYKTLLKEVGEDLALKMSQISLARADANRDRLQQENSPARRASRALYTSAKAQISKRKL